MRPKVVRYTRLLLGVGLFGVGYGFLKSLRASDPKYEGKERLPGRTIIVTGANSGIGKATATELARRGARVLMACRDCKACEKVCEEIQKETFNKNVHCRTLDLADMNSVRSFADKINAEEARVDILVNNAAVMMPPETMTVDGFELQLATNLLGPYLLTDLLLPKMIESQPARVINVSSAAHGKGRINFDDFNGLRGYEPAQSYYNSKLAIILWTKALAFRLRGTGVSVFAVNPGLSTTNIARHSPAQKSVISRTILKPIWWALHRPPVGVAQTTLMCVLDPSLPSSSGDYYGDCRRERESQVVGGERKAERLYLTCELWTKNWADSASSINTRITADSYYEQSQSPSASESYGVQASTVPDSITEKFSIREASVG